MTDPLAELPAAPRRCPNCAHAEHRQACRGKAASGCVPLFDQAREKPVGFVCYRGERPLCGCPARTCKCGARVVMATLLDVFGRPAQPPEGVDGDGVDVPVMRGSAGQPEGRLEVCDLAGDGSLLCRELSVGEETRPGWWRGTEHTGPCQQF